MKRFRHDAFAGGLAAIIVTLSMSPGFTQNAGNSAQVQLNVPLDHQDMLSAGATADPEEVAPGPVQPNRDELVGPNVRVNAAQQGFPNGLFGRSETTIAASADGQQLLAGFNDARGFCGPPFGVACTPEARPGLSGFAFSTNGGLSWIDDEAPDPKRFQNVFTRGDPWLDRGGFDGSTFFYANLAVDATSGATLGVSVHRGHFVVGGFAFEDVRTFKSPNPNDFYDKEAIAAAKDGSGFVVVSLTNFRSLCSTMADGVGEITVWRSHDGGDTWQGPVVAGPDLTDPGCNSGVLQQSSVPAIGPDGEVYVAWQRGPTFLAAGGTSTNAVIAVARSLDGGASFEQPVRVAAINSMRRDEPVGYNRPRINDHPRIAVATSDPHAGRVYVVFYSAVAPVSAPPTVDCPEGLPDESTCLAQRTVSSQVFISFSDDRGAAWSAPTPLAGTPPALEVKRFWPVVTVEPDGGVDVIFYESRETVQQAPCTVRVNSTPPIFRVGAASSMVDTFFVHSRDGGSTFTSPEEVSSSTSNWCTTVSNIRPNFGDYIGSASAGTLVLPVWADGRNGIPDTFFAPIQAALR